MAALDDVIQSHAAAAQSWPRYCCVGLVADVVAAISGRRPDFSAYAKFDEAQATREARRRYWNIEKAWHAVLDDFCDVVPVVNIKAVPGDVWILGAGIYWSRGQRYSSSWAPFPAVVGPDGHAWAWLVSGCRRLEYTSDDLPLLRLRPRRAARGEAAPPPQYDRRREG